MDRRGDRERRWRRSGADGDRRRPPRALVVALVLACASLITLDSSDGTDSVVEPLRTAVGEVLGPVEEGTAAVVRPIAAIPGWFRTRDSMRQEISDLEADNAELRGQLRRSGFDRNKLAEYEALTTAAEDLGTALVPARVVGLGPAQSFSDTVTIDAGSDAGLRPDMTVLNNEGLVGRILRVTRSTATVLLVVDADSVVGVRIGESMELGFLRGQGAVGEEGDLELRLVDPQVTPAEHDTVVTWGSNGAGPYVAGVPVGQVTQVFSSLRESTTRAVIDPFVDFSSLDVVGVVVPSGSTSDRAVIEADGELR